jgi:deoxyadenosine/deoxycytidine kinase
MKQIFVIGPSGVGKTALCKKLSEIERTIVHVSFDEQVKMLVDAHYPLPQERSGEQGREFWNFCKGVIDNLSRSTASDITLLFDVDAGAEYIPECQEYLSARSEALICLMATPDVIYKREMMRAAGLDTPIREKEVFLEREFSPTMERFYQSAGVMIDVSNDDVETSVQRLKAAVEEIRAK